MINTSFKQKMETPSVMKFFLSGMLFGAVHSGIAFKYSKLDVEHTVFKYTRRLTNFNVCTKYFLPSFLNSLCH